jgi:hypothetical protein
MISTEETMKKTAQFERPIEEMEWLRMATLLDTEGSIQIKKSKSAVKWGCRAPNHTLQITVTNTDPRIPLWCKSIFGGCISFRRPPKQHHRKIYRWATACGRAAIILSGCLPYFLTKRNQAEIAIASRDTIRNIGMKGHSEETLRIREAAYLKLQDMKREEFDPTSEHAEVLAQLDPRSTQN